MIVDKVPGQITMWWDQELDCLVFQAGDNPPVKVSQGDYKLVRFHGPDDKVCGKIRFRVLRS